MKLIFKKGSIDDAPKGYVRVALTSEAKGTKRFIREKGVETLEIGVGKPEEMTARKFITLCRAIVQAAKANKAKQIAIQFDRTPELFKNLQPLTPERVSQMTAENFEMANFEFTTFKTEPEEGWISVEEILLYGKPSSTVEKAVQKGQEIGKAVNACRTLANTPGGEMTPMILAKAAKDAVKGLPVSVKTFKREEIAKMGMGLLAGVGAGSTNSPTFTIMKYDGGKSGEKPIVLAGKGITFDSGGLNLKSTAGIYEMHLDMSGAAAVIHAVALAAKLGVKKNVIGLIPAAENLVGSDATRPGDIHKALSGKMVEITNTDAEGRLVLADAITYAKRLTPAIVIDVATLTGAAMVALGLQASALLTRDAALSKQLLELGEESGDYLWPLPMWDEYEPLVKSDFADIVNSSMQPGGRYGGTIEGGMFLWQFAKELECPWAHIDMAPRMTAAPGEELAKGAAGAPVRLLLHFIEHYAVRDKN